jgi:hypothetical protein
VLSDDLEQVYLTSLEGLGSSYRMKGYFTLRSNSEENLKISFEGVAFGGNYGGHNVSVSISEEEKGVLRKRENDPGEAQIEELLTEVQRRLLNNEMIVEYDSIKPEEPGDLEGFGKI